NGNCVIFPTCRICALSAFDVALRSSWTEKMRRGLFRYELGELETRVLAGPLRLVAQLNVMRGSERRKPQEILSVRQDFDPKLFNFNHIRPEEVVFDLVREAGPSSEPCKLIINVSPLGFGHCLIVPEPARCLPQILTPAAIRVGVECVFLSADPGFRVGFNSMGAFASVNHLHLHAYYLSHDLAVERAPTEPVAPELGLHVLTAFPRGFLFYTEGHDLARVAGEIYRLTSHLVDRNIAHNLFVTHGCPPGTRTSGRAGVRVVVWPRRSCFGAKEEGAFNVALCELAGHLPFKNREDFEASTEQGVRSLIQRHLLPEEQFAHLQTQISATLLSGMAGGEQGIEYD
uniref:GDP-D-glucose phosphorylase 1 n=1 Tax=Denticeps clupeoides TaxID=299321 RepID=A0AAY4B527_9TELE